MADEISASAYNKAFLQRTRALRERRGLTQAQMAEALGIQAWRYTKYENRSLLPHHLLSRFCYIVGCSLDELITGRPTAARTRGRTTSKTQAAA